MSHTASSKIPMLDMSADIEEHWDEYQDAFSRVMKSGQFIRGPEVAAFEKEVSTYLGCKHAIGVNSGTDALVIGLRAMGITTGDEVITTPFTFAATPESICLAGATPVFVDIEPDTFNINPDLIDAAITPKTKAIMPVHLFGLPANMPRITEIAKKHHLKIIEDTAQAFGSESMGKKAGTIGDVGAYSFFPSKNLGGFGDGGLIVTDNDEIAELARALSAHGAKVKYQNKMIGYNSRLDELQAALLRVRLPRVDIFNQHRRQVATKYVECLRPLNVAPWTDLDVHPCHIFHQFAVLVPKEVRGEIIEFLAKRTVSSTIYYPVPAHHLLAYRNSTANHPPLLISEKASNEIFSLPIGPRLEDAAVELVCDAIDKSPLARFGQNRCNAE